MKRSKIESEIFDSQIRLLYEQVPIVLTTNVANAGLIALVLAAYIGETRWWLFFGLVCTLTAARSIVWQRYRCSSTHPPSTRLWGALATAGSALSGLIWGVGAGLLLPDNIVEQTFVAFVIGGMCAGALVSLAYHFPAFVAYVLPATLPLAIRFLLDGGAVYVAMAMMVVLFAGALAVAAYNLGRSFAKAVRLQLELRQRSDELSAANERLRNEIAERRATESLLRQAQKMEVMGQLTGGIAHDFNNLLTAVIGHLELARRHVVGGARAEAFLQRAHMAAQRAASLTQHLLAFARRQHLEPKTVDVPTVVNGIQKLLDQAITPSIRLLVEAEPNLWPARVDPNQLELAILNLVLNARDAMPEGGTLRIRSEARHAELGGPRELKHGEYVVVAVSDTGVGMDAQTLTRAFEPFFTTKELGSGSGLGLPMVQGFALQSSGGVQVESARGKGTKVELWLPRAEAPYGAREVVSPARAERPIAPAGILVCDDDEDVREFVGAALRDSGYAVWEADRPTAALGILKKEPQIKLLLVDYAMPEMNGLEVMERARNQYPGLKLLLVTGHPEGLHASEAAGAPVLAKPFTIDELMGRVAESLFG